MNKKVTIVSTNTVEDFKRQVNTFLANGWELHGTIQVCMTSKPFEAPVLYTQLLVREVDE